MVSSGSASFQQQRSERGRGCSRAAAPVCGFARGTTARSVSLSWGAREVGSPCEWRGGARHCSRAMGGASRDSTGFGALEEGLTGFAESSPSNIPYFSQPSRKACLPNISPVHLPSNSRVLPLKASSRSSQQVSQVSCELPQALSRSSGPPAVLHNEHTLACPPGQQGQRGFVLFFHCCHCSAQRPTQGRSLRVCSGTVYYTPATAQAPR